jgi:hypothetical protein
LHFSLDLTVFIAMYVAVNFLIGGLCLMVPAAAFDSVVRVMLILLPGIVSTGVMMQVLRDASATTRLEEDVRAIIPRCRRKLSKKSFLRRLYLPDSVQVLMTDFFLVSTALQMGSEFTEESAIYAITPGSVRGMLQWYKGERLHVTIGVLVGYGLIVVSFFAVRVVHLPKLAMSGLFVLWEVVYDYALIDAMQLIVQGLRCTQPQSGTGEWLLDLDRNVVCDFQYRHRERVFVTITCFCALVFLPALLVLALTLNRVSDPLPRFLPVARVVHVSLAYSIVATDVVFANPHLKIAIGACLCICLLTMNVWIQPAVGAALVPNSTRTFTYTTSLLAFVVSELRVIWPEHEQKWLFCFAGSIVVIGIPAFILNRRRAKHFDRQRSVDDVVSICSRQAIFAEEITEYLTLVCVLSCSEPAMVRCKAAVDAAAQHHETKGPRVDNQDVEGAWVLAETEVQLRHCALLTQGRSGGKLLRKGRIIESVVRLLQSGNQQADVTEICLTIVEGALTCKGMEDAMAAYLRGILPLTKILKMMIYPEHEALCAASVKRQLCSILGKLKGPRDLIVSVRNWMLPEDTVGGVVVFDLAHSVYFVPDDDDALLGTDLAFLDFALCVLPAAQAEAEAAALSTFASELRLVSSAVVVQALVETHADSDQSSTIDRSSAKPTTTDPVAMGGADMIFFSIRSHEDVLESVVHRLDKLSSLAESLAEAKPGLSVKTGKDRRKSSALVDLHRDVGSGNAP